MKKKIKPNRESNISHKKIPAKIGTCQLNLKRAPCVRQKHDWPRSFSVASLFVSLRPRFMEGHVPSLFLFLFLFLLTIRPFCVTVVVVLFSLAFMIPMTLTHFTSLVQSPFPFYLSWSISSIIEFSIFKVLFLFQSSFSVLSVAI